TTREWEFPGSIENKSTEVDSGKESALSRPWTHFSRGILFPGRRSARKQAYQRLRQTTLPEPLLGAETPCLVRPVLLASTTQEKPPRARHEPGCARCRILGSPPRKSDYGKKEDSLALAASCRRAHVGSGRRHGALQLDPADAPHADRGKTHDRA